MSKLHLFENENIHNAIDNEESAHCYMLSMQEEGVLSPPTSQELLSMEQIIKQGAF